MEKPGPEKTPSLLGIQGRYIFTPDLFECQKEVTTGEAGEIQLTDVMQVLANRTKVYSWLFKGKRYDIGTMKDWFQSHIELSLESEFSEIINELVEKL